MDLSERPKRLTFEEAQAKATECRELASRALNPSHKIMLEHMVETWERIAADVRHNDQ